MNHPNSGAELFAVMLGDREIGIIIKASAGCIAATHDQVFHGRFKSVKKAIKAMAAHFESEITKH